MVLAGKEHSTESAQALETLCRTYWHPLFLYLRYRGYNLQQAEDLIQAFFSQLLAKNSVAAADRERGRFRTFLLGSLNHFIANEWNREHTQKRGGRCQFISLDDAREEVGGAIDPGHDATPERMYEKRWAEAVLTRVLERLRHEYDGASIKRFDALKPFLTEERGANSYTDAARELRLTVPAVKSAIHRLRQRWRELMREEIAHTLNAATSKDVDEEIRYLIGVLE